MAKQTTVGNVKDFPIFQDKENVYYVGSGNRKKRRGAYTLVNRKIGKLGWLGNPFRGNREEAIAQYKVAFLDRIDSDPEFKKHVDGLRGMILTCHCPPNPCHADVIAEYLNSLPEEE